MLRAALQGLPPTSFFAVYDGHGGVDAANYTASHFHCFLARNKNYPTDLNTAILETYRQTDEEFIIKAQQEVGGDQIKQKFPGRFSRRTLAFVLPLGGRPNLLQKFRTSTPQVLPLCQFFGRAVESQAASSIHPSMVEVIVVAASPHPPESKSAQILSTRQSNATHDVIM